jgi:hypothetical protein
MNNQMCSERYYYNQVSEETRRQNMTWIQLARSKCTVVWCLCVMNILDPKSTCIFLINITTVS